MTIKYNSALTLETIDEPVLDNYKADAAYFWSAYDPSSKTDSGDYPAYRLVYIVPENVNAPEDEIDWTDPDDIQQAGSYDPATGRIF